MGCDIHAVLETKTPDGWVAINTYCGHHTGLGKAGTWDWSSPITTRRNYQLFAALAGVRGSGPAPRGVPADASETTKFLVQRWGADGHSHSWLPAAEAAAIYAKVYPDRTEYPESYFLELDRHSEDEEYRLVFWFDN